MNFPILDDSKLDSIGVRDLMKLRTEDLKNLKEPLIVTGWRDKLAVLFPYEQFVEFQELIKKVMLKIGEIDDKTKT